VPVTLDFTYKCHEQETGYDLCVWMARERIWPKARPILTDVVAKATRVITDEFKAFEFWTTHNLFVVARQCYLYVEVAERWYPAAPQPPVTKDSKTHYPLGRLHFMGDADAWEFQPYLWSDECWDDRDVEDGSVRELAGSMILRSLCS